MKIENAIERLFMKLESYSIIGAIRQGLTKTIPIAILGSLVVLLQELAGKLQSHVTSLFLSYVQEALTVLYAATFGMIAVYIVIFISISYMERKDNQTIYTYGATLVALAGFVILNGGLGTHFVIDNLGVKGTFSAILSSVVASTLYYRLCLHPVKHIFHTDAADSNFNQILSALIPICILLILFVVCNTFMQEVLGVSSIQALFSKFSGALFRQMKSSWQSAALFVLLSSIMWMFGIHGNNVLADVQQSLFTQGVNKNILAVANLQPPTELFTGTFFNIFVFVGGCGSLLCLLIAVLLFSKRGNHRYLAKVAILPTLFNVNELLMFGLPVVMNPYMMIPFILTPLLFMTTSALSMSFGLVPYTIHAAEWTTPVFFSGYITTGSMAGSLLQLFNLALGVLLYCPFIRMYDRAQMGREHKKLEMLVQLLQDSEENNHAVKLMEEPGSLGNVARNMAEELQVGLAKKELHVFYQAQYNEKSECIGAEALLRWKHPLYGMIYPPLIIKLAEEAGILYDLEQYIFYAVATHAREFQETHTSHLKFSVNVTVKTLMQTSFELFLNNLKQDYKIRPNTICIEITEQMAMNFDTGMKERLERIHIMGYQLAIDDFAMGNTSLKYLQSNQFNTVKLDGSLVKDLSEKGHNKEIISSIVYLARSLNFEVLAEYVETEENRKILEEIGCDQYQGYLYGKAIPYVEFCNLIEDGLQS
ncbi:MAG: EAL domain-containing protein [Lachnospiraceae bacterium]